MELRIGYPEGDASNTKACGGKHSDELLSSQHAAGCNNL
jgi:hypothetical protein